MKALNGEAGSPKTIRENKDASQEATELSEPDQNPISKATLRARHESDEKTANDKSQGDVILRKVRSTSPAALNKQHVE